MSNKNMKKYFCWLDIETTGLDEVRDDILEMYLSLTPYGEPDTNLYEHHVIFPWRIIKRMIYGTSDYVIDMHKKSGLFDDIERADESQFTYMKKMRAEEEHIIKSLDNLVDLNESIIYLAGNSVHFDRRFIKRYMPKLEKIFYHRLIDVSSSMEILKSQGVVIPFIPPAHRACDDIAVSKKIYKMIKTKLRLSSSNKKKEKRDIKMARILMQLQLSNYAPVENVGNRFILSADSGYQMMAGRIYEMLKFDPELIIDIILPEKSTIGEDPLELVRRSLRYEESLCKRLKLWFVDIPTNAIQSRHHFNTNEMKAILADGRYDVIYINDPLHLKKYKSLCYTFKKKPKFIVHSHFIDNPECPKFPTDVSMWHSQVEAAIEADYNFWQCESAYKIFIESMKKDYSERLVQTVMSKSSPWDDGYSHINIVNTEHIKKSSFIIALEEHLASLRNAGKRILFIPNRVGKAGVSSDYTNCGKLIYEILPQVLKNKEIQEKLVIIVGNPNQKIPNSEIAQVLGPSYLNIFEKFVEKRSYSKIPVLTRDEYVSLLKYVDITASLYNQDSYGGTAARECIAAGSLPYWLDCYEYRKLANLADFRYLVKEDFSDAASILNMLIQSYDHIKGSDSYKKLQNVIYHECAYESTTYYAMKSANII